MFTDIKGFTRRMEQNESGALQILSTVRNAMIPLLDAHSGELIKEMGDGSLSLFLSARNAVNCARELQRRLSAAEFSLRIGIHHGQVLRHSSDILGDTVNVASRLEKMAPPGGICVSGELICEMGPGRKPALHSMGLRKLKGLGRLVELFTLKGTARKPLPFMPEETRTEGNLIPIAGEVPSVTVLPLDNLGVEEDSYYAYGITADIVSDISSAGGVAVTPLADVMKLRKTERSRTAMATRFNTRFLVIGALGRIDRKFRLSMELHDLKGKRQVWTDSWTDHWFELPSIRRKVSDSILKALGIRTSGEDLDDQGSVAYELYLRASDIHNGRQSLQDVKEARKLLLEALEMDPEMISARILLGTSYTSTGDFHLAEEELSRAHDTAQVKGDRRSYLRILNLKGINLWRQSSFTSARRIFRRTLILARSLDDLSMEARSLNNIGLMECNTGNYESALEYFQHALEVRGVNSMGSLLPDVLCNIGLTHWFMGDNAGARDYYTRSLEIFSEIGSIEGQANMNMNLGIVVRNMGRFQESMEYTETALQLNRQMGNRQGICRTMVGMGNCRRFVGDFKGAYEDYRGALAEAEEMGDRLTQSICKTNIADLDLVTGRLEAAEAMYGEALAISRDIDDVQGEGEILAGLGAVLLETGSIQRAGIALEKAVEILSGLESESRTVIPRLNLARIRLLQKDPGEAEELLKGARKFLSPDTDDFAQANMLIARILGELSEAFPERGEKLLMKSRKHAEKAREALARTAATIEDEQLRESFLSMKVHRRILEPADG